MKKLLIAIASGALLVTGCSGHRTDILDALSPQKASAQSGLLRAAEVYSKPVAIPTANRMIKSYLTSIDYQRNTDALRSWVISADTLRSYLSGPEGGKIVGIKLMLAHTMAYIHSGREGRPAPVNSHDVTVVLVGVDADNNLVYNAQGMPYDYAMPCPPECLGDTLPAIGNGVGLLDTLAWQ